MNPTRAEKDASTGTGDKDASTGDIDTNASDKDSNMINKGEEERDKDASSLVKASSAENGSGSGSDKPQGKQGKTERESSTGINGSTSEDPDVLPQVCLCASILYQIHRPSFPGHLWVLWSSWGLL